MELGEEAGEEEVQQLGEEVQAEVEELEDLPWEQEQVDGVEEWRRAWRDVQEGWEDLLEEKRNECTGIVHDSIKQFW